MTSIKCVLLGAGLSRRFGGDKLSASLNGVPIGEYAIRLHGSLPYVEKIFITRSERHSLIDSAKKAGFTVVINATPEEGIASSIRLGIAALNRDIPCDGVLFGVCDQPYLTRETVEKLFESFARDPARIVAPCFEGERGNPVIFPGEFLGELALLQGDRGGGAVIKRHPERLVTVPIENPRDLRDIDCAEELTIM